MTLQEAIEKHISSSGNGFEMDYAISSGRYPAEVEDGLYMIARKYKNEKYPMGIDNPDCFDELVRFGQEYQEKN